MGSRLTPRLLLLGIVCSMLSSWPISAQLPPRLEKCLPNPTLAHEIREMLEEAAAPHVADPKLAEEITEMLDQSTPRVNIERVIFQGTIHVPESVTRQIAANFEGTSFETSEPRHAGAEATESDWLEWFRESVREAWQEHCYFYARVNTQAQLVGGNLIEQRISLTVHVDEGPRFRLGAIRFNGVHVFPPSELRKVLALPEGEVFNIAKVRSGLEALKRHYDAQGYINAVGTPDIEVDRARRRISLLMDMEEGKQFRLASITVLALDPQPLETILRRKLRPGDIFNAELVREFYKENKSLLPPDASPADWEETQHLELGTVDLVFDFRTCPEDL